MSIRFCLVYIFLSAMGPASTADISLRDPRLLITAAVASLFALLSSIAAAGFWSIHVRRLLQHSAAELTRRAELEALMESRRSHILEDICGDRPLREILEQITGLVSFHFGGAFAWISMENDPPVGKCPPDPETFLAVHRSIPSRSGAPAGELRVAFPSGLALPLDSSDALSMGTWLATLAIEARSQYSTLLQRSQTDLLTGMANRFTTHSRIETLIQQAGNASGTFGLIYIDLDRFKQVNDTHGHHIGDLYLQTAAQRMKRQLRPDDLLGRVGGDEFVAVLFQVNSRDHLREVADRLESCFVEAFSLDGHSIQAGASVGTALYPHDGITADALLTAADTHMYIAKQVHHAQETGLHLAPPPAHIVPTSLPA